MKTAHLLGSVAFVATALTIAAMPATIPAQDQPIGRQSAPGQDPSALVEAFKQAAVPGPQHKQFAQCVGTWTVHYRHWMVPGQPPEESDGTSSFETIMGGRFLVEHAIGEWPTGPFEGQGTLAYDQVSQQFEHVWLDDTSTGLTVVRGPEGSDGSMTLKGETIDPITHAKVEIRLVSKMLGENERLVEMFCNKNGLDEKVAEISYTRGVSG